MYGKGRWPSPENDSTQSIPKELGKPTLGSRAFFYANYSSQAGGKSPKKRASPDGVNEATVGVLFLFRSERVRQSHCSSTYCTCLVSRDITV